MKRIKMFFIAAIFIIIMLPLLQMKFEFFSEVALGGYVSSAQKVSFTPQSFENSSFQVNYEKYFNQNLGFRGYLVRTYSQIYYSLFKKSSNTVSSMESSNVIIGENDYLYQMAYISDYYINDPLTDESVEKNVLKIRELQDELKKRGLEFVFMIAPSKVAIYEEYVPDRFKTYGKIKVRNYDKYVKYFDEYGINYIDMHHKFLKLKTKQQYELFPITGVHWNHLGAFYALNEINAYINKTIDSSLDELSLKDIIVNNEKETRYADLYERLNILKKLSGYEYIHVEPNLIQNNKKNKSSIYRRQFLL